jgi:hypothetical protein
MAQGHDSTESRTVFLNCKRSYSKHPTREAQWGIATRRCCVGGRLRQDQAGRSRRNKCSQSVTLVDLRGHGRLRGGSKRPREGRFYSPSYRTQLAVVRQVRASLCLRLPYLGLLRGKTIHLYECRQCGKRSWDERPPQSKSGQVRAAFGLAGAGDATRYGESRAHLARGFLGQL